MANPVSHWEGESDFTVTHEEETEKPLGIRAHLKKSPVLPIAG